MGAHKERIDSLNKHLTLEQKRANNVAKTKARNEARRADKRQRADVMHEQWRSLSPRRQLAELDRRPGLCLKQAGKIFARMTDEELFLESKLYCHQASDIADERRGQLVNEWSVRNKIHMYESAKKEVRV